MCALVVKELRIDILWRLIYDVLALNGSNSVWKFKNVKKSWAMFFYRLVCLHLNANAIDCCESSDSKYMESKTLRILKLLTFY